MTTGTSFISATNTPGANAGSGGNVRIDAPGMAVFSFTNGGSTFSINAGNFQVSAASLTISGATVNSLSASTSGNITFNNNQALQLNNLAGNPAISTPGTVNLSAIGNINQNGGTAGQLSVGSFFAASANGTSGSVILPNTLNAIGGTVSLTGLGTIAFTNSLSTTLNRVAGDGNSQGNTPAQSVDIEVIGAGHSLTLSAPNGTAVNGNGVTLHAAGDILAGTGSAVIAGINLGLISDTGSIGGFSSTGAGQIPLRGVSTLAARAARDIYLISSATLVNNAVVITPINIGTVSNQGPGGGSVSGISAGGIARLGFGSFDVRGSDLIKADTLFVSGNSIELANIAVNTLSAFSQAGTIDITSNGSFNINNTVSLANGPGISTTGAVFLTSNNGSITQSSGTSGSIVAGSLSALGYASNILTNTANAITGYIEFGSLGDASLYNSLTSHLRIGIAGGTFTLVSGGDLELMAGLTIAQQLSNSDIDDPTVISALNSVQLGGMVLSLKNGGDGVVLATSGKFINNFGATAILVPGSRFLIYSADPAANTFGGLKTPNAAVFGASYPTAITAAGSRYIFSVASSTNTDFLAPAANPGLVQGGNTAAAPALVGFISGLTPPPRNPLPPLVTLADALLIAGLPPLLPPPPPPPPHNSPLGDLAGADGGNAEPPSSSDQATSYIASSLEGGLPLVVNGSSGTIIPHFLTARPDVPFGTLQDPSLLPAFGNLSLWQ